jgi:glucose dehydrogenase
MRSARWIAAASFVVLAGASLVGQSGAQNGEWRSYGGDVGHTRYSPLDQIDARNFNKLEIAWRFKTDNLGARPEYQFESTPLMAKGVLYSTAGSRRAVVALDAATGEMLWMHSENEGARGAAAPRQLSGRGLADWSDGRDDRILYVTPGYRLIALDAKTGIPVPGFGQKGVVDLKLEDDQEMDLVTGEIGLHSTPTVAKNVVIVGAAHKTGGNPKSRRNEKGYVRGYDVRTGKRLWIFHTIPLPGEWYSPTQPFPTKPPAYERQGVSIDDLIDFTPELRAEAMKVAARYKIGPIFTPPVVSKLDGPLSTLTSGFATNWPGGAYDPETHIAYIYSQSAASPLSLVVPPADLSDMNFIQGNALSGARRTGGSGSSAGGGRTGEPAPGTAAPAAAAEGAGGGLSVQGLPLLKPPYSRITAIDLNKGDILWHIAHGETPDNIRNHPALKGLNIPRTGRPGLVGPLVTKTLLIAGEGGVGTTPSGLRGAMLRAYNKSDGKDAGAVYMPAPESGSPMTYMLNGKQYIVLAVSGGNYSGELLAFRLPGETNRSNQ